MEKKKKFGSGLQRLSNGLGILKAFPWERGHPAGKAFIINTTVILYLCQRDGGAPRWQPLDSLVSPVDLGILLQGVGSETLLMRAAKSIPQYAEFHRQ
jgi:hypothetical protein